MCSANPRSETNAVTPWWVLDERGGEGESTVSTGGYSTWGWTSMHGLVVKDKGSHTVLSDITQQQWHAYLR